MAFVRPKARILERTITAGNGPYALAGAVDGSYNSFASFMAIGDATEASIVEPGVAFWTGIVTYSDTDEITLTTVEETSGTFGTGTKEIFTGGLASRALLREDISGAIVTGGTSTAYTVASFRDYDTLARLADKAIAFTPHATNGATVTLNVDGLGAKPLRAAPSTELLPGVLIQGTPYMVLYNNSDQVFYLHGFFGNPYDVPLGSGLDYWGPTAPNSAFAFPFGQALSRTVFSALFTLFGTTFGSGNGVDTFNIPDLRGRFPQVADNLGGTAAGRSPIGFNQAGGAQNVTLVAGHLPPHSHTVIGNTVDDSPDHDHPTPIPNGTRNGSSGGDFTALTSTGASGTYRTSGAGARHIHPINLNSGDGPGSSAAFSILPPTLGCRYIMRVL